MRGCSANVLVDTLNIIYHIYHKEQKNEHDLHIAEELDNIINSGKHIICILNTILRGLLMLVADIDYHFGDLYQYIHKDVNYEDIGSFVKLYYGRVSDMVAEASSPCDICDSYTYNKDEDLFRN
jgi:hypothetical protein